MPCPSKVWDYNAWLKEAQKAIPEIPKLMPGLWKIKQQHATPNVVVFELCNFADPHTKAFDFCHVIIDRKASSLG